MTHPTPTPIAIWVCTDCYFEHHYPGENEQQRQPDQPEPWSLYDQLRQGDITDWTSGPEYDGHGDPEFVDEFGKNPCSGCGSRLWGARFRMADWQSTVPNLDRAR